MVEAATVDHGLRVESAAEARQVAALCADLGVTHEILPVTPARGNLQGEARKARYTALGQWMKRRDLALLATAHHADDQAETLLMRLNRGSGVSGLAGVRRRGPVPNGDGLLIRPLLGWRKGDLVGLVEDAGIACIQDPSNRDPKFDRARIRDAMGAADWLDIPAIGRSAAHLAEAENAIAWIAAREWEARVRRLGRRFVYRPYGPRIARMRVIERIVTTLGGKPRGSVLASLLDRLERGEGGNVAGVLATIVGDAWRFEKEPPRKAG